MYHLSRIVNGFLQPKGSAANEETAKSLLNKFEDELTWERGSDGTWIARKSDHYYYTVDEDYAIHGRTFAKRR
jgi:hypothetical protein